jgi:uncharacterized radical SAM superfamily Fe-S cluster-containing enzyme
MSTTGAQRQRDYVFHEMTRSLCPTCLHTVDAKVLIRDGRVFLSKWCPEHGDSEALVSSDADWHLDSAKYNRPGRVVEHVSTPREKGCPWDCGICADHEQHTCVGLIDVTDACNLRCPTCFAEASGRSFLTLQQVEAMLDAFIRQEGSPTVLQISGGEPTEHPQILEILRLATGRGFPSVMLNTNGLRLGRDPEFADRVAELRDKMEVYLQLDSLKPGPTAALRGVDCLETKLRAIENCRQRRIPMHLSCTVKKGTNDAEIGDLVRFGVQAPFVRGINFQPAFWSGRFDGGGDPLDRTTLTDVLAGIESQTRGMFRRSDFVPLPCSHPSCIAMTYAWIKPNGKVKPIPRFVDVERHLKSFTNTIFMNPMKVYEEALSNIFSMSAVMSSARTLHDFSCVCGNPFRKAFFSKEGRRELQDHKLFRILVIQFEDRHTFDLKRVKKCCIGQILPDGRIIPFCSYNTLYRKSCDVSHWVPAAPEAGG